MHMVGFHYKTNCNSLSFFFFFENYVNQENKMLHRGYQFLKIPTINFVKKHFKSMSIS